MASAPDGVVYRIGPVALPWEFDDIAGPDLAAVFATAHQHWPDEPLFCRERCDSAAPASPVAHYVLIDGRNTALPLCMN